MISIFEISIDDYTESNDEEDKYMTRNKNK